MNRREFITAVGSALVVGESAGNLLSPLATAVPTTSLPPIKLPRGKRSRVVLVRSEDWIRSKSEPERAEIVADMVDTALCRFSGDANPVLTWRRLLRTTDIVGLKLNCLAAPTLCSSPSLVNAIAESIAAAGVPPSQILIWDRLTSELETAGYTINEEDEGFLCHGTDKVGYSEVLANFGNMGTRVTKVLTDGCSVNINVPVLKTHELPGMSAALKNHFGSIVNPGKFHRDHCCPFVADVNCLPAIRSTQRFVIVDALRPLYAGGPEDRPNYRWDYGAIVASSDPVAVDSLCYQILVAKRRSVTPALGDLEPSPEYIEVAADYQHNLGIADLRQVDVVEVAV